MPKITYDMELTVAFTFDTPDPDTGKRWLKEVLDCVEINAGCLRNGHVLVGEATLNGEAVVGLIDGDVPPPIWIGQTLHRKAQAEHDRIAAIYANAATDLEKRMEPYRPVDEATAEAGPSAFEAFKATRKRSENICADFSFDDGMPERGGFIYEDSWYIEDATPDLVARGKYYLMVERFDWISDDLEEMEKILWAMHAVYERDDAPTFTLSGADLDYFVQGYCAANNITVDGDVFGLVFSGAAQTVRPRKAAEMIDGAARIYSLYKTTARGAEVAS